MWQIWDIFFQHPYQTLWGRSPFPEIRPCWWPCRCRYPRRPVGCCGWLTCCAPLPACWKCTALTAPAAALSCTNEKQKAHTTAERGQEKIRQPTHAWPQNSHCSAHLMLQMYNLTIFDVSWSHKREAKCRQLDFEVISIYSTYTLENMTVLFIEAVSSMIKALFWIDISYHNWNNYSSVNHL